MHSRTCNCIAAQACEQVLCVCNLCMHAHKCAQCLQSDPHLRRTLCRRSAATTVLRCGGGLKTGLPPCLASTTSCL